MNDFLQYGYVNIIQGSSRSNFKNKIKSDFKIVHGTLGYQAFGVQVRLILMF